MHGVNDELSRFAATCATIQDFEPKVHENCRRLLELLSPLAKVCIREKHLSNLASLTLRCLFLRTSSSVKQWLHCKYIVKGFSYMCNHLTASGRHQTLHLQSAEQRAHEGCRYRPVNFAPLATWSCPTHQTVGHIVNLMVVFQPWQKNKTPHLVVFRVLLLQKVIAGTDLLVSAQRQVVNISKFFFINVPSVVINMSDTQLYTDGGSLRWEWLTQLMSNDWQLLQLQHTKALFPCRARPTLNKRGKNNIHTCCSHVTSCSSFPTSSCRLRRNKSSRGQEKQYTKKQQSCRLV